MRRAFALTLLIGLTASPALAETVGLPQMDPTWFKNQLVWLGVSFALLYLIASQFIAPTLDGVFSARERAINEAIAKAEELKATAAGTRGNTEAAGAEARSEAATLIADAQAQAAREASEALARLNTELEAKAQAARSALAQKLSRARLEIDDAAQGLAEAMVAQLLTSDSTAKQAKKAS